MKTVQVVGVGLGIEDLGPFLSRVVQQARVLAGGKRLLDLFPHHPGPRLVLTSDLPGWLDQVEEAAREEEVAVLASGDPNFFGIAARIVERLGRDRVVLHPNVTAIQAAFARLKQSWQNVEVVSLHGRSPDALFGALVRRPVVALFTDPVHSPVAIARLLLDRGLDYWQMHVLENLGSPEERVRALDLEQVEHHEFSPLNVTVLQRIREPELLTLGTPDEHFLHEAGLITKSEVRSVALGKLALRPWDTVWDLGAGCGSVGLEASLLTPFGRVWAVEKKAERVAVIQANRKKFGRANLEVMQADLPEGLDLLPTPDRVFMGGGGPGAREICLAALDRMESGILVAAVVMMSSLEAICGALTQAGLTPDIVQVQVGRGRSLGNDIYLKALNPVWIISATKSQPQDVNTEES